MLSYLINSGPFRWIIAYHSQKQVFEFIRTTFWDTNLFPVIFIVSITYKIIELIVIWSWTKWENCLNHYEQNNSSTKNIDLSTIIGLIFYYFRCHIDLGSSEWSKHIDLFVCSNTEISYFKIKPIINQNVFRFEVSVDQIFFLHIAHSIQKLVHEISAPIFTNSFSWFDNIIKKATWHVLQNDEDLIGNYSTRWLDYCTFWPIAYNLINVFMIKSVQNLDFWFNLLNCIFTAFKILLCKYLECYLFVGISYFVTEIYLGSSTITK